MTRPKILAYYFPSWHEDARNATWFGDGWSEWKLLEEARPRFEGHRQPRVPALGPIDEAKPEDFDRQVDLAVAHGVDGFIFDFYWYDDGPYLQRALDEGCLGSRSRGRVDFALMWANHNLVDIFPSAAPGIPPQLLKSGPVDRAAFERMARHVIDEYFSQPDYLRVEGRPWFSIYEIGSLVAGLGGIEETADALRWFDEAARDAGLGGVHFDAVVWGFTVLPTGTQWSDPAELISQLGFSSATSYVWIHHIDITRQGFPRGEWDGVRTTAFEAYEEYAAALPVPFWPNVTVGWDASPRTQQGVAFTEADYPWITVWDPSPEEFGVGLEAAKSFVERHPGPAPMVTINAWNEWTEGSTLLPDTVNGTRFLEQITRVFGPSDERG